MLEPIPAELRDVEGIWLLRRQREDWLAERGIEQWRAGEVPASVIEDQVGRGEWHILRDEHRAVIAGLRVLWSDPDFWGPDDGSFVYVHGLMVDLTYSGRSYGAELLDWAERLGVLEGKSGIRLDSAASNSVLLSYYESLGFRDCGRCKVGDPNEVVLWEKSIGSAM